MAMDKGILVMRRLSILYLLQQLILVQGSDYSSPRFIVEPPSHAAFSNSSGSVIPCSVDGRPVPTIKWILRGGGVADNIPGLRLLRHDGSLVFPPFPAEEYRADVHAATYRCVATNNVGSLGSRDVQVRVVVLQRYEIRLFDEFVIKGNMAVLRCPLPSFVSDYIIVSSWERSDGFLITSETLSSKYGILSNGDLYIRDATDDDNNHSFRCHTESTITKEKKVSTNFAKIIVTEPHHSQPPRLIWRSGTKVTAIAGKRATLSCASQGYPVPSYRWHKKTEERDRVKDLGPLIRQEDGILVFRTVRPSDSGKYICVISNTAGQEKVETELIVEETLRLSLTPSESRIEVGDNAVFNCTVSGTSSPSIIWRKDMSLLPSEGGRISFPSPNVLQLRRAQRGDTGIYQCFVNTETDSAQISSRLIIGDIAPKLKTTFPEKTVRPGTYVSLLCIASGNPVPQFKWWLDGLWMLSTRPNILVSTYLSELGDIISYVNISSVAVSDGGLYTCEVSNEAGSESHSKRLNVIGPLMIRTLSNVTALAGDHFKIICPFAGYPFQSVRWKKEGRLLPVHQRQKVFPNGTLLIQDVQPDVDDGYYGCVVTSTQQAPVTGTFRITVRTRPKLAPFAFQDNLHEGMRTAVTCIVSAGDPPFTMQWMKDGRPLNDGILDVKIMYGEDGFVSTLTINKLAYRHNGNYSCLATNDVATGVYEAGLTVKVPPRWILEPKDSAAIAGKPVMIDCQADGVPQPHVRWKMAADSDHPPETFNTIVSSSNVHILVNGSLNFRDVEPSNSGFYLCEANNGVGAGLSIVVKLTVHSAPHFQSKFLAITARRSERIIIDCRAHGDKPMYISWRKNGAPLDPVIETRYSEMVEETTEGKRSQLLVAKAEKKDTALYTCTAVNDFGDDFTNIQVTIQDIPEAPQNLEVHDVSSRSVRLTWNRPFDGNSPILSYTVSWRLLDEDTVGGPLVISGSDTSVTVRSLIPLKRYFFRVKCENALGESQYSAESAITTLDEPPKKSPGYVKAVPLSSRAINVTWQSPWQDSEMGTVDGFYVGYKIKGTAQPYTFKPTKTELSPEISTLHHIVNELERFTEYSIVVQAFNSRGAGPPSDEIYIRTLKYDPPTSPLMKTFSATARTLHLTWELKNTPFSPISGYVLYHRTEGGNWHETHVSGNKTSFTLRDLLCGTTYICYLVAYNGAGRGNVSDLITARTDGNAPIAPDKRLLLTPNSTSVCVHLSSWYNGGCPVTFFVIQYKMSGQTEWTLVSNNIIPQQHNVTITSLTPGTWYSLMMTARNDAGTTDAEYIFATYTLTGEYPMPPSEITDTGESLYRHLTITVPVLSSSLVLVVVLCVVCLVTRRRTSTRARPNTPDGADGNEATKNEQLPLAVTCDSSEEPAYFPTPYATSRVSGYSRKQQHCMQADDRNQEIGTFGSIRSGYTYDIPCLQRRLEKTDGNYDPPVVYFTSYHHAGIELRPEAIYEVPHRRLYTSEGPRENGAWREAGDGDSSIESDNDELMYSLRSTNERMIKEEARESETECDRLWKTFQGSQYEAVTR